MTGGSSLSETVTALASSFTGQLLLPGDADYDEARKVHNGLIDKRPALIARCRGLADIVDAVKMARDQKLEVAVRGGGHHVAGRAPIDRGMMIDLSLMKGILRPVCELPRRRRIRRFRRRCLWTELSTPAGAQSEIRSAELFPRESEHPSTGVNRLIRG